MPRLYVGNLPYDCSESEIRLWLEAAGYKPESVEIVLDLSTGLSRGFGFVNFPVTDETVNVINHLNGKKLRGHTLRVSEARPVSKGIHPHRRV